MNKTLVEGRTHFAKSGFAGVGFCTERDLDGLGKHDRAVHLRCKSAWLSRDQVMVMTRRTMVIMAKIMMMIVMRNEDDDHHRYVHLRCKSLRLSRDHAGDCGGDDGEDDDHGDDHDGDGYEDDHHNKMVLTIFKGQAAEFTSGVRHGFCDQQNVLRHSRELLERRWGDNINLPFFSVFVFAVPKLEST